jgi:hypothetical protein
MVGSGGVNKGIWDENLGESGGWFAYTNGTDCYFATSANYNNVYLGSTNVYVNSAGVLYGAAWNDYAEYRESIVSVKAGKCVKELGNGKLQ